MELINIDRSHYIMAFNDKQSVVRMAERCKNSSLLIVYANSQKELDNSWIQDLQSYDTPKDSAASVASALNLLNRMNGSNSNYYFLVVRKTNWA